MQTGVHRVHDSPESPPSRSSELFDIFVSLADFNYAICLRKREREGGRNSQTRTSKTLKNRRLTAARERLPSRSSKTAECAGTRVLGQGDTVTNLMARYIRRNGRAKLTGRPSGAVMIVSVSVPIRPNGNVCKPQPRFIRAGDSRHLD